MRQGVTAFRTLKHCIKEMQRFILDGKSLESGKCLDRLGGMRPREVLGCWMIAAVFNYVNQPERMKVCTDTGGSDGTLYDTDSRQSFLIEQVMASNWADKGKCTEDVILEQINNKQKKGGNAYSSGKILVVFLNRKGTSWQPNKVTKKLPKELGFSEIWVFGLQEENNGSYIYNVTLLEEKNSPIWIIKINADFDNWTIKKVQ